MWLGEHQTKFIQKWLVTNFQGRARSALGQSYAASQHTPGSASRKMEEEVVFPPKMRLPLCALKISQKQMPGQHNYACKSGKKLDINERMQSVETRGSE